MKQSFCEQVHTLEEEFKQCRRLLNAIGDENRQHLLCVMMESPPEGSRVVDIAAKTHLSRPAVSHHIQILKEAGILRSRKEGTCVYYYFDPDDGQLQALTALVRDLEQVLCAMPRREKEE